MPKRDGTGKRACAVGLVDPSATLRGDTLASGAGSHRYTDAVRAIALALLLLGVGQAWADDPEQDTGSFAERPEEYPELVDEDEQYAPKRTSYAFNPVQARNELKVGNYYAKKGKHRAAAGRYLEATRWDTNFADAFLRLGLAQEKLDQPAAAIEAYTRFLSLESGGKRARQTRQRIQHLQKGIKQRPLAAEDVQPGTSP